MKKLFIALIAIILVLVIALVAFKVTTPTTTIDSQDPDSLYAYSYVEDKKGLIIKIGGDFPEGTVWKTTSMQSKVEITDKKAKKGEGVSFLMAPKAIGADRVLFSLMGGENAADFVYEISCDLFVDTDGSINVMTNSHREAVEAKTVDTSVVNIKAVSLADGSVKVYLKGENCLGWMLENAATDCVEAVWESEDYQNFERVLSISYLNLGQGIIYLNDLETDEAVQINVSTNLLKNVTIEDCFVITNEAPEGVTVEELAN